MKQYPDEKLHISNKQSSPSKQGLVYPNTENIYEQYSHSKKEGNFHHNVKCSFQITNALKWIVPDPQWQMSWWPLPWHSLVRLSGWSKYCPAFLSGPPILHLLLHLQAMPSKHLSGLLLQDVAVPPHILPPPQYFMWTHGLTSVISTLHCLLMLIPDIAVS